MSVLEERAATLDTITLDHGSHQTFDDGHCALEVVAWLAADRLSQLSLLAEPA